MRIDKGEILMFAPLFNNFPGIITALISAIPALLLAINTIVNSHNRKPIELIDPAFNLLGITYTALDKQELKAFRKLKLKKYSLIFAFLLITYVTIYLFISTFILADQFVFLYIAIAIIIIFFILFMYIELRGYRSFDEMEYPFFDIPFSNVEFAVFQKAEMMIQADYPYLIAKFYQALKSLRIQTVKINSDEHICNGSLSSSKIAITISLI